MSDATQMTTPRRGRPTRPQNDADGAFARNLRRLREAAGWTQTQLADAAGVHLRSISSYESGSQPYLFAAAKIAKALGTTVDAMLREESKKKSRKIPN